MPGNGPVRFGGRPSGKGPAHRLAPRRSVDPTLTVREQFLVEVTGDPDQPGRRQAASIGELNRLFTAWAETACHRRVHPETGQAPSQRWADGWNGAPPPLPEPARLHEAFLHSERRTVRKTATVSLHGNTYQAGPSLALRKAGLVFDPFDLTRMEVRWQGRAAGQAIPHVIGRHHAHPKARPEQPAPPAPVTGIDYIGLIDTAHDTRLAGAAISFAGLASPEDPAQLTIDDALAREDQ